MHRDTLIHRQAQRGRAVRLYWLVWTIVVGLDAASYRQAEYHSWLLSRYAWWMGPIVLWWTLPRDSRDHASIAWPLFIVAWASWRFTNLAFMGIDDWPVIPDDSSFAFLQMPIRAAIAGVAIALAFSRPVVRIAGGLAGRAALVVGFSAVAMSFRGPLLDIARWQSQPFVNFARVFDGLLIVLILAASAQWGGLTIRDDAALPKSLNATQLSAPRFAGFGSVFALASLSIFASGIAREATSNPFIGMGIGIVGALLPVGLATSFGVRAWHRLGPMIFEPTISKCLSAVFGRVGVVTGVGALWIAVIWIAAPIAGRDGVEILRTLPGPVWSVRAFPERAAIALSGELESGVADAIRDAVRSYPSVQFLELNSPGGRLKEASLIAMTVDAHGLITVAREECSSACGTILAAGRERWMIKTTKVGLHSPSELGLPVARTPDDNAEMLRSQGISEVLARHAGTVPSWDVWYPTENELLESGLITRIVTDAQYSRVPLNFADLPTQSLNFN